MLVLDSNVMLRVLLKDDPVHSPLAREACARAQALGQIIYVPQAVVQEVFWVLERVIKLPRLRVVSLLDAILCAPIWEIEQAHRVARAIRYYEDHAVDFTDALLAATTHEKGMEGVLSFDADMGKMGVPWVKP